MSNFSMALQNRYAELFHTINLVQLELEKFNARNTFIEP